MTIEAIFRDVQFSADKPFREGRLPFEDLFPRLLPDQFAGLARPEFFRLTDRFPVHSSVLLEAADTGFLGKITRGLEDAVFLEVGLDVLFHEGNGTLTSGSGVLNEKFIARRESGKRTRRLLAMAAVRCFQLSSFLGSPMVCGMSDHVYKKLELVGSSTTTIEDAVQNALSLAGQDDSKHAMV